MKPIILSQMTTPAELRRPALVVGGGLAVLTLFSAIAPWQQTATGSGQVVAFSPTDRSQPVEAPVKGRIIQWHVIEGSEVKAGDPIVEIGDVDPRYVQRLQQEREAIAARRDASLAQGEAYAFQAKAYEQVRKMAVTAAQRKIEMSERKVEAAQRKLEARQAALEAAQLNLKRVQQLTNEGLNSDRDAELARLAVAKAETGVGAAEASVGQAQAALIASQAEREVKEAEAVAKVASAEGQQRKALAEAAKAAGDLAKLDVTLSRQESRRVTAPRDGVILSLLPGQGTEIVKEGDQLAVIVPNTAARAVEVWVDGNDVPLVQAGRRVRLQFEGWPAVQFAGWPSVAVGTFGGMVSLVDAQSRRDGNFRVLVVPDGSDDWPPTRFLRQGVKAKSWVLLDQVPLYYELWRRANGFPATSTPTEEMSGEKKK